MPLLADRVKESTTTQGTGTLTLAGAPPGFRTFTGAFGNGASVYYVIAGPTEWEIGFGTTGAGTLTRDTVLVSSAGGTTKVNLSAGPKDVFCSYVADRAVTTSDAATLTNKTIDDYTNNVGANSTHFRIKASGTLAKGTVVKAVGFTPGEQAIEVAATSSASDVALGISEQALTTGQFGMAVVIGELFDVNTNGLAVGATLYSNNAGSYTTTKPSSGFYQSLGWVVRANLNNGVIAVNVVAPLYVETSTNTANTAVLRDGSGNFAAGTITAALTGNASTATALQTARNINGVSFNGTADITVAAAAVTLTGTTLASNVVNSSLTSVGTLANLTVTNPISGSVTGSAGSVAASALTGTTLASGVTASSLTSVGTLSSLTVSGNISVSGAGSQLALTGSTRNAALRVTGSTLELRDLTGGANLVTLGLTSGQLSALNDMSVGGNLAVDTNTLFVDAVNNSVGVGTASPTEKVEVSASNVMLKLNAATDSFAQLGYYENGALKWNVYNDYVTDDYRIGNSSGLLLSLTASGNLGLGVTPSAWDVGAFIVQQNSIMAFASGNAEGNILHNAFYNSGAWKYIATREATRYQQANGAHAWYTAPSGTAGNAITFTQAMTLDANGGLQTLNTIGVGNRTPATSGAGISFPATQSASSDANTLDDYEEGTWVPTLTNLTLGNAVTAFRYVKVGQMVTLDIVIEWGSTTSSSGQWRISLPFNAQATGGGSAYLYDDTGSEYVVPATVYTASFGQTLVIGSGSGAGFVTNTAPFTWAQNDRFGCSITYRATA